MGAPYVNLGSGTVYLYDATTGALINQVFGDEVGPPPILERLGVSVDLSNGKLAIDTNQIFVGDPNLSINGTIIAGIAYRFDTTVQITAQPQSQAVDVNAPDVNFSVAATNVASYQWSLNGTNLTDGPLFTGTDTNFLIVTLDAAAEGTYQVTLTGIEFGVVQSDPAVLAILGNTAPDCPADLNIDGTLNFYDVSLFIQLFFAGCS